MNVIPGKEVVEQTKQLCILKNKFEDIFCIRVEPNMYWTIHDKFVEYISNVGTEKEQAYLEAFVEDYFDMQRIIVDHRNAMIEYRQSEDYKHENFINKIKVRTELSYWQSLCVDLNQFEEEFYERTNISLLRVENERYNKEQQNKNLDDTLESFFGI